MLGRNKRLDVDKFQTTFQNGQFVARTKMLSLKRYNPQDIDHSRYAISVPKKVTKSVVMRNKIRRKLFMALKELDAQGAHSPAHYIVFANSTDIAEKTIAEIEAQLIELFKEVAS